MRLWAFETQTVRADGGRGTAGTHGNDPGWPPGA